MEYRIGNSKKVYARGETETLTCPKCENKVRFSLFSNFEARLTVELPLVKTGNVYFLVCPSCGAIYGVDEARGKQFQKGEKLSIGNFDLKELEPFEV